MHVAVLGSGLAGLTAAGLLARKGHRVSLYEQHPEIGGVTSSISSSAAQAPNTNDATAPNHANFKCFISSSFAFCVGNEGRECDMCAKSRSSA